METTCSSSFNQESCSSSFKASATIAYRSGFRFSQGGDMETWNFDDLTCDGIPFECTQYVITQPPITTAPAPRMYDCRQLVDGVHVEYNGRYDRKGEISMAKIIREALQNSIIYYLDNLLYLYHSHSFYPSFCNVHLSAFPPDHLSLFLNASLSSDHPSCHKHLQWVVNHPKGWRDATRVSIAHALFFSQTKKIITHVREQIPNYVAVRKFIICS